MDEGDLIAIGALVVSAISLTYTYVADHRTPRLRVSADHRIILETVSSTRREIMGHVFMVSITNHGPGRACVLGVGLRPRSRIVRLWQSIRNTMLQALIDAPLPDCPGRLPCWLEVGESVSLTYPQDSDIVTQTQFDDLMVWDSLGRYHSAPKNCLRDARRAIQEEA